jgi:hypothetical protein
MDVYASVPFSRRYLLVPRWLSKPPVRLCYCFSVAIRPSRRFPYLSEIFRLTSRLPPVWVIPLEVAWLPTRSARLSSVVSSSYAQAQLAATENLLHFRLGHFHRITC